MIREEVLDQFYEAPPLNHRELVAIGVALPFWVGVNVFLNRPKSEDNKLKNEWPQAWTADHHLQSHAISWAYKRGPVRFCHIEYELRRQAAQIIFDRNHPRRRQVRRAVNDLLREIGISLDQTPHWWRTRED